MRAFIRHEHGLVDAGEVIEIDNASSYGGIVMVRTSVARADVDGHVVARILNPEAALERHADHATDTHDADLKASAKLAENLAHAIGRALRFAKYNEEPTVIDYNRETHGWTVTALSLTASEPAIIN